MSPGHESGPAVNMPYFFLSYARTPSLDPGDMSDPDEWVYKLYQDLCKNILGITNARRESAGFMDRNNRPGAIWTRELSQALATCRVFVPLYSQRYFSSENCGMEWFAFACRKADQMARGQKPADAIVPALWAPVRKERLPEIAKDIQYIHPDLGPRYGTEGFFGLIKLKRYEEDYEVAVYELARRIVDVADETMLSPDEPTKYGSLENAFHFQPSGSRETAGDQMQITVLALDTGTLPKGRKVDYYGSTPHRWMPYHPDSSQPLAEFAAGLAAYFGCQVAVGTFDEHTAGWVANGRPIPPGLCLVDPWVAVSPAHQDKLRRLDELGQSWVSVMVPWNSDDADLTAAEQHLREALVLSLGRKLTSVPERCRMAATGIPTLREFGQILPRMAMIMLKRFRSDENVPTYPPEGDHIERPRIRMTYAENQEDPDE